MVTNPAQSHFGGGKLAFGDQNQLYIILNLMTLGCILVSALGLGLLALGTSAVPVAAGYGLLHGAWIAALISLVALRQSLTPLPLQGRVGAAERFIALAGGPLGAYLGGIIGDRFGAGPVFAAGAALAVVLAAGGWRTGLREA